MRSLAALLLSVLLSTTAAAQDRANTILVLDGSGSMWGQIDGVNKIVIARDVVSQILGDFPADQNLGLAAYGHRTRGDCTDIEMLVPPGPDTRDAIAAAVNAINPRGKTPMTDAIIAAAETLRYTEEAATVILVSDGIETCNPDPCAAARALEQAGIAFTAHVVGFDVGNDAEALAQMQCLADETGGQFLTAANADELGAALTQVATAAPPEPEMITVNGTFTAVIEGTDAVIAEPILWTITSDAGDIAMDEEGNPLSFVLLEGSYRATAYRILDEMERTTSFTITGPGDVSIDLAFPEPLPSATVMGPETAPQGATIPVTWTGPAAERDYISVGLPDGSRWINYTYIEDGSPLNLLLPPTPGTYELRYQSQAGDDILASQPIIVTPAPVTLAAPDSATVGDTITVDWTGPAYERDYISVGRTDGSRWITYTYVEEGSPLPLRMPTEPGSYEVRYQLQQGDVILATRPIEVTAAEAALIAPDTATVGETITVGWTGPAYARDYISVGLPDGSRWINYTYVEEGNPLTIVMPTEPGTYEVRYQLQQGDDIIATRPITVSGLKVGLTAPDTAAAGSTVMIGWDGPGYDRDYLAVGATGSERWITYVYTEEGNPAGLQMPIEPGSYELRYHLAQGDEIVFRQPITVTPITARMVAPATASLADGTVTVGWDGPDYARDYIGIGPAGDSYRTYAYTEEGNPVAVPLPDAPGDYEIRYYAAQGDTVLATIPLTVTE